MAKYLVVGGVAGGAAFAAKMRRLDEHCEIIVFEKGPYVSYANCGLPYYIGGVIQKEADLLLNTPQSLNSRFNMQVLVNNEVVKINRQEKYIEAKNLIDNTIARYDYDKLMLSPGGYAVKPNIEGIDLEGVFKVKDVPDTIAIKNFIKDKKPKTAAVIGGGFIGLEMAENLHAAGLQVTIVEAASQVMMPLDSEMVAFLHNHIRSKNVELKLNQTLKAVEKSQEQLLLKLNAIDIKVDMVILGIGMKPNTALAVESGLKLGTTGGIKTNQYMQTSDENIYAAGDSVEVEHKVTGNKAIIALAGNANKQARIAAMHIVGRHKQVKNVLATSVVKVFDLTVATTGANEKQLKVANIDYDKVLLFPANHATYFPGSATVGIKLLFSKSNGKILGAQAVGEDGTDKRIDVIAAALMNDLTVYDLGDLELSYAPPYSSTRDPVNYAGDIAANVLSGDLYQYFCEDCKALANENAFFLDTRTMAEFNAGTIYNAVNIPLHELRNNLDKLPKDKEIYVFCHSGLRSYIANRILRQHGFNSYNLSGGYLLWSEVVKDKNLTYGEK